jgi:hypothetical protein
VIFPKFNLIKYFNSILITPLWLTIANESFIKVRIAEATDKFDNLIKDKVYKYIRGDFEVSYSSGIPGYLYELWIKIRSKYVNLEVWNSNVVTI